MIKEGHYVHVLDNLSSGKLTNLEDVKNSPNLEVTIGDIKDYSLCVALTEGIDYIIHQAALVSVPKSIENPLINNDENIMGFLNILEAARENKVKRVIYASSSAVYGNDGDQQAAKSEEKTGALLSPYALSKYTNELYAKLYSTLYNLETVGLRYFNVYGPKQDSSSVYSGVISIFVDKVIKGEDLNIYGDGNVVRDFVYVDDVARANILATKAKINLPAIYNIGTAIATKIGDLGKTLIKISKKDLKINYLEARLGDVLYSRANIDKVKKELNFKPTVSLEVGLEKIYFELSKNKR